MKTIEGKFFDGLRPVAIQARMDFEGPNAILTTGGFALTYAASQLSVSPRTASASRFIALPDGRQFFCPDQEFLDALPQESPSEGIVAWLENRTRFAFASVVIIIATLLLGYFYGLPRVATRLADRMPMETEQALGQQVLSWFDEQAWLKPSRLDYATREKIQMEFDLLSRALPFSAFYQLEIRSGEIFGPNAVALPGGIIVLTDELVELADSKDEIMAVLAHEIGHIELRHAMRTILQDSIVAAAITTVTSDAVSLSAAVTGLPVILAQTKYSREFETAADTFAFHLLKKKGRSPEAFASIMQKLSSSEGHGSSAFSYMSTHPVTEERVQRARDAAQ